MSDVYQKVKEGSQKVYQKVKDGTRKMYQKVKDGTRKYKDAPESPKTPKDVTIKSLNLVKSHMDKIMKEGIPLNILPTIPMPPQVMILEATVTATAVFNQLKDFVNSHKGKIAEIFKNEVETKIINSEVKKAKAQNELKREKQQGGSTFSEEECDFF
jgi:hypothetical protein